MSLPETIKAIVVVEGGKTVVGTKPLPTLTGNEILVKVRAVAQNPTDWKHAKYISKPGDIIGCDFAGEVVQLSPNGENNGLEIGSRVAGMVHGGKFQDKGAFAEYLKVEADLTWKIPENVTYEQASTLGIGLHTPVQGYYGRWGWPLPSTKPTASSSAVLVWSGASSAGFNAIQLAKLSGFKVVTTASPSNHALLTSIGADTVFDYNDPEVVEKIKAAYPDLEYGYDCIVEGGSTLKIVQALGPKGGKVITLLSVPEEAKAARPDVSIDNTLLYSVLGVAFEFVPGVHIPVVPSDRALVASWYAKDLPALLSAGKITYQKLDVRQGLEAIEEGFSFMASGKVRASKLVYVL